MSVNNVKYTSRDKQTVIQAPKHGAQKIYRPHICVLKCKVYITLYFKCYYMLLSSKRLHQNRMNQLRKQEMIVMRCPRSFKKNDKSVCVGLTTGIIVGTKY